MMIRHMDAWKARHPRADSISNDDLFLRRGLSLDTPLDEGEAYKEWDYINSYSIAFSAPEKLAQMITGKRPAIVNGNVSHYTNRILFFSPFVPGMPVGQLEAGIIPTERAQTIEYQGEHDGILEYILP